MKLGRWYHLIAQWDGGVATLEVNGEKDQVRRSGPGLSRRCSAQNRNGRREDRRPPNRESHVVDNAGASAMVAAASADGSSAPDHFGQGSGWSGWVGGGGARVSTSGDILDSELVDSNAMIVNPAFDLDLTKRNYVCCDISCSTARQAQLTFITDTSHGTVQMPIWPGPRTSVVDLADVPNWRGRLKLLAISILACGRMRSSWRICGYPTRPWASRFCRSGTWLRAQPYCESAVPRRSSRVVHNLGMEAKEAGARLKLPEGVKYIDGAVRELGAMATGTVKTAEWTVTADSEISDWAEVVLTAANGAPCSHRCKLIFRPVDAPPEIKVRTTGGTETLTYYIDSIDGDNANTGRSPVAPWKDFTNITARRSGLGKSSSSNAAASSIRNCRFAPAVRRTIGWRSARTEPARDRSFAGTGTFATVAP